MTSDDDQPKASRRGFFKWVAVVAVGAGVALLGAETLRSSEPGVAITTTAASSNSTPMLSSPGFDLDADDSTIKVKVMYFQMLQYVDTKVEYFVLQSPAQLGTLLSAVTVKHPSLAPVMSSMIILVDGVATVNSAPIGTPLKNGDEVVIIPSIAGG